MSRTILVTGGNRGIGLATARAFATAGHKVAVTYRSSEPPDGLFGVKCDVTDATAVEEAFTLIEEQLGSVEVLVCNAGITRDRLLIQMSEADFGAVLDTNLIGAFLTAKRAVRKMLAARWGRLIFVSSVAALRGEAGQVNYAASKAALIGLARSLAREVGSRGITANVVAPGLIDTDMTAKLSEKRRTELISQIPAARIGQPDDVAAAIAFLASEAAAYITGAVLAVDGGVATGH